jgi:hypothetical protein
MLSRNASNTSNTSNDSDDSNGRGAIISNTTRVDHKFNISYTYSSMPPNFVEAALGTVLGPIVLFYGYQVQAIVTALNAAYAANVFGLFQEFESIQCMKQLKSSLADKVWKVGLAAVTIAAVGLRRGSIDLLLKVHALHIYISPQTCVPSSRWGSSLSCCRIPCRACCHGLCSALPKLPLPTPVHLPL